MARPDWLLVTLSALAGRALQWRAEQWLGQTRTKPTWSPAGT